MERGFTFLLEETLDDAITTDTNLGEALGGTTVEVARVPVVTFFLGRVEEEVAALRG